jgi:hypothetical protein
MGCQSRCPVSQLSRCQLPADIMASMIHTFFWLTLFGMALGFFEASVVVYLRQLYYPGAALFPLQVIPPEILKVELLREFFSLVLILAAAMMSGRFKATRFANFLFIFGAWDLFYYIFLRVFLGWPASLLDWDILFLIPVPWVAPVLAPVLCSLTFIAFAVLIHRLARDGWPLPITMMDCLAAMVASLPIMVSFFLETRTVLDGVVPQKYSWPLLLLGLAMAWGYAVYRIKQIKRFE